ncbi:hypothetical protein ACB092_05G197700 [Castanea dentata]
MSMSIWVQREFQGLRESNLFPSEKYFRCKGFTECCFFFFFLFFWTASLGEVLKVDNLITHGIIILG